MRVVDPQSTTFQRSEAWRLAARAGRARLAPALGRLPGDLGRPEARGDRRRGQRLHRAQRRRVGRAREGLGAATAAPMRAAAGRNDAARHAARRRAPPAAPPRSSAARRSPSSWPRTCSSAASATSCARRRSCVLSWELEAILGKRRILEIYLNSVEWGEGVFGAEAAARRYFGVGAARARRDAGGAARGHAAGAQALREASRLALCRRARGDGRGAHGPRRRAVAGAIDASLDARKGVARCLE